MACFLRAAVAAGGWTREDADVQAGACLPGARRTASRSGRRVDNHASCQRRPGLVSMGKTENSG